MCVNIAKQEEHNIKQIMKASGMTDEQIKTSEVRANQDSNRMKAVKPEDEEPMSERFTDAAMSPMVQRPGR